jgi:hypothetical protein
MPAADVVDSYVKGGPRFFDAGVFNEFQLYVEAEQQKVASSGTPIDRWIAPGWEFQAPRNTFGSVSWHAQESVRAFADSPLRTTRFVRFDASTSPGARWAKIRMYGDVGRLMDFGSGNTGRGYALATELRIRPNDFIEIQAQVTQQRLRLATSEGGNSDSELVELLFHSSVADSVRLEWTHGASRVRGVEDAHGTRQGVSLVFEHRPSLRNSLFAGAAFGRRGPEIDFDGERRDRAERRVFVKWTFGLGK